jgi:hypothetical protein
MDASPCVNRTPFALWRNPRTSLPRQMLKLAWIAAGKGRLYRAYLLKEQLRMALRITGPAHSSRCHSDSASGSPSPPSSAFAATRSTVFGSAQPSSSSTRRRVEPADPPRRAAAPREGEPMRTAPRPSVLADLERRSRSIHPTAEVSARVPDTETAAATEKRRSASAPHEARGVTERAIDPRADRITYRRTQDSGRLGAMGTLDTSSS